MVVPCLFDQVALARRQQELGNGVWVRRRLPLAAALDAVPADDRYADRARAVAAVIGAEDATRATADLAEAMAA
ncbi:MAG TPA: hypothetical protein VFI47_03875 [Acidimicrobiales bacterium]|nr:hypothetical protein [Acidimicrobiales bacterium]